MSFNDMPRDDRTARELQEEADDIAYQAIAGLTMREAVNDPENPFAVFLAELRNMAARATLEYLDADLYSEKGIEEARGMQREVALFKNAIAVVIGILESGLHAADDYERSVDTVQTQIRAAMEGILVRNQRDVGKPDT